MPKYIDADTLIAELEGISKQLSGLNASIATNTVTTVIHYIADFDAADVAPIKRGAEPTAADWTKSKACRDAVIKTFREDKQ